MPEPDGLTRATIPQLRDQLEQFRSTHPVRTRLPASVWKSAAELARRDGIYVVARSLRLDYNTLKKHVNGSAALSRPRANRPAPEFMELIGAASRSADEYVIEVESVRGSKLRIRGKTATAPDWAALLRAWGGLER
jgi:hypothetical protein